MARTRPFRRLEIDLGICDKVARIMNEKRYRGSFTSFVESVLEQYVDGLLTGLDEANDVKGVRVRRMTASGQRKTA